MKNTTLARAEIQREFPNLTPRQIWLIVKIAKHVRLRCRNNTAFNNWFNAAFSEQFQFRTVNKTRPSRYNPAIMESYPGLQITAKDGTTLDVQEDESEE